MKPKRFKSTKELSPELLKSGNHQLCKNDLYYAETISIQWANEKKYNKRDKCSIRNNVTISDGVKVYLISLEICLMNIVKIISVNL